MAFNEKLLSLNTNKEIKFISKNGFRSYYIDTIFFNNPISLSNDIYIVATNTNSEECIIYNCGTDMFYGVDNRNLINTDFMLKIANNSEEFLYYTINTNDNFQLSANELNDKNI